MRAEKRLSESIANHNSPVICEPSDALRARSEINQLWKDQEMRRLIIAGAAVALLAGAAVAATDNGMIKQIDPKSDAITLADGNTFTLAEGTEAESLKIGQTVKVTYHLKSGKMVATEIVVAK
jgi:Cu/Ag efflux protein CusF